MLKIKNISAGYSNKSILKSITFNIKTKSFTGIIGRNGAGKSTLLKVICAILKQYNGNIYIDDIEISDIKRKDFSKKISFMPQNVDTSFPISVENFVLLGRYPYMNILKIPKKQDYEVVEYVLKLASIWDLRKRNINELSGGEKQKVLIAQTLAQETDIIVLDEPTSHLDIGSQNEILELLKELNEKYSKTIITTLHDLNAAGEYCNNLIFLNNGKIHSMGSVKKVLNYKDIEKIYKTTVLVKENPLSLKPYVIPISKQHISNGKR